jgi:PAS domain S-box-containing protein
MGRVVTWNAGAQHVKGYTKPEIIGEHFSMFYTAPDREDGIPERNLETAARAGSVEDEGWRVRADGSRFWASITITAMYDETGELTGYGKVTQDTTDGREYEQQLERQNERLADFASVISHDLMNPLLVAASSLDLAREDSAPENFDRIEAALKRMEVLIADLRTLAVEGQAVEDTEPVSLEAVAESAWETTQRDGASLEVLVDDYVKADQARLRQLLENLLSNAVTHGGSDVTIWVGQLDDRDGFYVADDGPGIPTAIQADVFERGYTTSETGTGFGLSIVREIANAHGWTVHVTDSAEGGARFEVRFE